MSERWRRVAEAADPWGWALLVPTVVGAAILAAYLATGGETGTSRCAGAPQFAATDARCAAP